ncbi:hypothetical protein KM043_009388 [Ampulex compressa]|nr:hypothetical protein KM043_009388 [Ampulex compressa]
MIHILDSLARIDGLPPGCFDRSRRGAKGEEKKEKEVTVKNGGSDEDLPASINSGTNIRTEYPTNTHTKPTLQHYVWHKIREYPITSRDPVPADILADPFDPRETPRV